MNEFAKPNPAIHPTAEDAAWASINTPLSVDELHKFCADIERLFRINPFLEIDEWTKIGARCYTVRGRNSSQGKPIAFEIDFELDRQEDAFIIQYCNGLKSSTIIRFEPADCGSKLTITDNYDTASEQERKARLEEVDKSLVTWMRDLQLFLINWKRWSRIPPWRWYMQRIWLPMKPTARRITYMLLWITVVEIALIALGAAIYWAEYT